MSPTKPESTASIRVPGAGSTWFTCFAILLAEGSAPTWAHAVGTLPAGGVFAALGQRPCSSLSSPNSSAAARRPSGTDRETHRRLGGSVFAKHRPSSRPSFILPCHFGFQV